MKKSPKNPARPIMAALIVILHSFATSAMAAPPDLTAGGTIPSNLTTTWNLGPTGMRGWVHYDTTNGGINGSVESRQIQVREVDAGSPAAGVFLPINLSGVAGNAWLEVQRRVEDAASPTVSDPLAGVYLTRVIYDTDPEGTAVPGVEAEYDVVATVDENGIVTTAAGPKVTAFSVSGGTATITIKDKPDTSYTVKTSTTLSGFTAITPTSGSTTTDGNGDATFAVDAIGPKRFYVVGE